MRKKGFLNRRHLRTKENDDLGYLPGLEKNDDLVHLLLLEMMLEVIKSIYHHVATETRLRDVKKGHGKSFRLWMTM